MKDLGNFLVVQLIGLFIRCGRMVQKEGSEMTYGVFWLEPTGCMVFPFTEMGKPVVCVGVWFLAEISNSVLAMLSLKCLSE